MILAESRVEVLKGTAFDAISAPAPIPILFDPAVHPRSGIIHGPSGTDDVMPSVFSVRYNHVWHKQDQDVPRQERVALMPGQQKTEDKTGFC
jgi:hypothetical protein